MSQLKVSSKDRLASAAKGIAGMVPVVGTIVGEIIESVIPNLRIDRTIAYLEALNKEVISIDGRLSCVEKNLKSEEGVDLFEEGIIQASRAISEDRKQRLARLVAKSLSLEEMRYAESRKLLNIYDELTDPEIVWLIFYSLNPSIGRGPHSSWIDKHSDILSPISRVVAAPQEQHDRGAIQDSYKLTLSRLGLTEERLKTVSLTDLGRLMVRYITDLEG